VSNVTRRQWLALAGAALFTSRSIAADNGLSLGFSLYGMKTLKLADAIKLCAAIGYRNVELALMPGWPSEPKLLSVDDRKTLRKQLSDNGLSLSALMENLPEPANDTVHESHLERLRLAAALGHELSPDKPPVIETVLGGKPVDWDNVKDKLGDRLKSWATVAEKAKTIIAIKPHVAGAMHTPEAALWLLKQVNSRWIKLVYDHSHYALRGLKQADTIKALAAETVFLHVKDGQGTADKFEFLLPGDGKADWVEHFKLLSKAGYKGPVVVEVSGQIFNRKDYDAEKAARQCYKVLSDALMRSNS